jgi:hypothetical protein
MITTSPGLIPVRSCSSTMALTCRETWGMVAATWASATAPTPSDSGASVFPFFKPGTVCKAWKTAAGTSSCDAAHLNTWRMRPICRFTTLRDHSNSTIARCTALRASGPKSPASVAPYNRRRGMRAYLKLVNSRPGLPSRSR